MRALTRTLVSVTTAVGIATGSLAAAGTTVAAPVQDTKAVAGVEDVAPLAVNNLGLSSAEAKNVQDWLKKYWGYAGAIDGLLGTNSWKAYQRCLKEYYGYSGAIDGVVGSGTVSALQRMLKRVAGYDGAIDGIAGPKTKAAFKWWAAMEAS
ncbi:peptidoglycan-binding domain-containing protein [Streptomyces phaeochromogenes]